MKNIQISPSILSADFSQLGSEIKRLEEGGADMIHVDVMDGHFVPNLTIGPPVIKALRKHCSLKFDVHLMISPVHKYIEAYADAGADIITIHPEATDNLENSIKRIKDKNKKVGVSLNPESKIDLILDLLDQIDLVLIMSVNPGFGGQKFMPEVLEKTKAVRDLINKQNLKEQFNKLDWNVNDEHLLKWKKGKTGFPIVDAGMRELWETGYMHNRLRMITASFLVKNLLIHWKEGEKWFWDCLLDADLANNSASWQWVAGTGSDAAPFFRIFNPITQGQKFDKDALYIRKYLPEIAKLPNKFIFTPWLADKEILKEANVTLGVNYPHPIIDYTSSRKKALDAFKKISN